MEISELVGQAIDRVEYPGHEVICLLHCTRGMYAFVHHQDCCESVGLQGKTGMDAILGKSITAASITRDHDLPPGMNEMESFTNTKVRLTAGEHTAELWFLGESNGYYSESVHFEEAK
jgi:hypothetical protein